MLIIIEGLDRTGKSTLASYIAMKNQPTALLHYSKPEKHPLFEYVEPLLAYDPCSPGNVVLDRGHLGESVWPQVFGRGSELDEPTRRWIELFMLSRGAVLVHAKRDLQDLIDACAADDEPIQGEQIVDANAHFHVAFAESALPQFPFCQSAPERELQILDILAQGMLDQMRSALITQVTGEWIGNPRPHTLLVGDQGNLGPGRRADWPLPFVPFSGTSGHFLFDELGIGDRWRHVAVVNSRRPDGEREDLPRLHALMGYPRVVTLGEKAHQIATDFGVEHGQVPHPQYVRRFERRRGRGYYAGLILEASS